MTKPTWDEYFLNMLPAVAARGTCDRAKVGAIITMNNRIISTGYNGAPPGLPECGEVGHLMELRQSYADHSSSYGPPHKLKLSLSTEHCTRTIHAEVNAVIHAKADLFGATLYCSMTPCRACASLLISAGIKRVVCAADYHAANLSKEWFELAGVELVVVGT